MRTTWLLWIWLASGEPPLVVAQPTELACDRERAAIQTAARAAERQGMCPMAVDAACVSALATPELFEEGPSQ